LSKSGKEELHISDPVAEQKSQYIKHIEEMTTMAITTQNIKDIMLMGEYRAIEVNTRMRYEIEIQSKLLE
jgi:hypothetical protein